MIIVCRLDTTMLCPFVRSRDPGILSTKVVSTTIVLKYEITRCLSLSTKVVSAKMAVLCCDIHTHAHAHAFAQDSLYNKFSMAHK